MHLYLRGIDFVSFYYFLLVGWFIVFNATFNNISVISWRLFFIILDFGTVVTAWYCFDYIIYLIFPQHWTPRLGPLELSLLQYISTYDDNIVRQLLQHF